MSYALELFNKITQGEFLFHQLTDHYRLHQSRMFEIRAIMTGKTLIDNAKALNTFSNQDLADMNAERNRSDYTVEQTRKYLMSVLKNTQWVMSLMERGIMDDEPSRRKAWHDQMIERYDLRGYLEWSTLLKR